MEYLIFIMATVSLSAFLVIKRENVSDRVHNIQSLLISFVITGWFVLGLQWASHLAGLS